MEKKASRRTAREIYVHVGGWHLLWCQSDDDRGHRGKSKWRVVDEDCSEKPCQGEMGSKQFVAVPWRKNEDDTKMDGERLKSEVIVMDKEYREKLEAEEHVPVPKRVYISRENLEEFGFTARCPGCMSLLRGIARQAHTENCRRRIEEELKGTAKALAATRLMKEYQDRAAEKETKRTKADQEEERQQREH